MQPMTGYATHDEFYSSRFHQGKRRVYSVELTPSEIAAYLSKPDPQKPTEGNRMVRVKHAEEFGTYLREQENWVCPALLLRSPDIFKYEVIEEIGDTEFGKLEIPRNARSDIRILDGQHRILGIHLALEAIAAELENARDARATAKKNGPAELVGEMEAVIKDLEFQRKRLATERLSVQIIVEDEFEAFRQMFVDIADNALGISSSIRTRFDQRKVVNRCVGPVSKNALLNGRVDEEKDRLSGSNPNLIGAKHVADMIRTVTVGIGGRISKRQEDELREDTLVENTNHFLDALMEGFGSLALVADGELEPEELRKKSILGSSTFLRVLAGVYHDLRAEGFDDEQITAFFSLLDRIESAPVGPDSPWVKHVPGEVFSEGAMAPKARRQDLSTLVDTIVGWAKSTPTWLDDTQSAKKA